MDKFLYTYKMYIFNMAKIILIIILLLIAAIYLTICLPVLWHIKVQGSVEQLGSCLEKVLYA